VEKASYGQKKKLECLRITINNIKANGVILSSICLEEIFPSAAKNIGN